MPFGILLIIIGLVLWAGLAAIEHNRKEDKKAYEPLKAELDLIENENQRRIKLSEAIVKIEKQKEEASGWKHRLLERKSAEAHQELLALSKEGVGEVKVLCANSTLEEIEEKHVPIIR